MDDEALRNLAAHDMALGYVVEILLSRYLSPAGEFREGLARSIVDNGKRYDQFFGLAKTEAEAELLSDIAVRMHGQLEELVNRALARLEASREAGQEEEL